MPALALGGERASQGPAAETQPRHPRHAAFATLNLLVRAPPRRRGAFAPAASPRHRGRPALTPAPATAQLSAAFAAAVAECVARGRGALTWHAASARPAALLAAFLACVVQQSVLEFYWHWAMHAPQLYRRLHAIHHYYKSPQPFDDLCIHPLEAFGYFCILYSPAAVDLVSPLLARAAGVQAGPCHVSAFVAYMALCGVCGVLDHSGVRVRWALPGGRTLYDTEEHDAHHSCGFGPGTAVNLGFPFAVLDRLHGTYVSPQQARARLARRRGVEGGAKSRGGDQGGEGEAAAGATPRRSARTAAQRRGA